ncbi:MAG: hypothetical protein WBN69_03130 [Eudoraea sp.]
MKSYVRNMQITGLSISLLLFTLIGCDREQVEVLDDSTSVNASQLQASDESELILEEMINIGDDIYAADELSFTNGKSYNTGFLPSCALVTSVIDGNSKETKIDFGTGCELPNGNVLGGILIFNSVKDTDLATKTVLLTMENFSFNSVQIEGGATIVRNRSNTAGNPNSEINFSFKGIWPNDIVRNIEGNRTREWIEGYGSGDWGDNVILINGESNFTTANNEILNKKITIPVRREWSCRFIVSGTIEVVFEGLNYSLDFGNGSCDSKGILTKPDGTSEEIALIRFRR